MSITIRQLNSSPPSGEPPRGCIPTGVQFTIASKNSRAQLAALHHLGSRGASQRPGAFRAPRAKAYNRARLRQRKRGRSRRASGPEQKDAASGKTHAALQTAKHSNIVRIVPVQTAFATNHHSIDRPDSRGQRIAVVQVTQDTLLVRNRDRKAGNAKRPGRAQEIAKVPNQKRHKDGIEFARAKRRVMHQRRQRMADGIADHAVNASSARNPRRVVKMLHRVERELAGRSGLFDRGVRQGAALPQR